MATTMNSPVVGLTRPKPVVPSSVLGTILFIIAEVMFFAAFISAYTIVSSGAANWPPLDQPRLPVAATALNTVFLLLSGVVMFLSQRAYAADRKDHARKLLLRSILLGSVFVILQSVEWVRMLGFGLTMQSSTYGSFFYLIVGTHALHAIGTIGVLVYAFMKMRAGTLAPTFFYGAQAFWYFVVGVWPVLYVTVYLN